MPMQDRGPISTRPSGGQEDGMLQRLAIRKNFLTVGSHGLMKFPWPGHAGCLSSRDDLASDGHRRDDAMACFTCDADAGPCHTLGMMSLIKMRSCRRCASASLPR
jgi:hypothetical protein